MCFFVLNFVQLLLHVWEVCNFDDCDEKKDVFLLVSLARKKSSRNLVANENAIIIRFIVLFCFVFFLLYDDRRLFLLKLE